MFKVKMAQYLMLFKTYFSQFHIIISQRTVRTVSRNLGLAKKITKFAILSRGLRLWNKIVDNNTKAFTFPIKIE